MFQTNTITRRAALLLAAAGLLLSGCGSLGLGKSSPPAAPAKPKAVVALALGGGASKGFAHIGVLKVLQENRIPVDIVTGTSAGAVVGSLYASGMSLSRLELEAEILQKTDVVDLTLSTSGFIKGDKLQDFINQKVRNRQIQQFPKKFAAVATEFGTGRMAAFNYGNAGQAVRASVSIPNVFQPTVINGKRYADGGGHLRPPGQAGQRRLFGLSGSKPQHHERLGAAKRAEQSRCGDYPASAALGRRGRL